MIVVSGFGFTINVQYDSIWHGKQCAICLANDDALNVHLDNVVPILDSLGLKGTFYLFGYFPSFRVRVTEWKSVADKGHELGNHTLFHPCKRKIPGREWVKLDYDLSNYTIQRLMDEIRIANTLLKAIDGKTKRTFAYPCGDKRIGDSLYVDKIRDEFVAARAVKEDMSTIDEIDLFNVWAYMVNG